MGKIYEHRVNKLKEMDDLLLAISEDDLHYKTLIKDSIQFEKKAMLKSLIYKIDESQEDVFKLAIHLKKIGINQFFEVLKSELNKIDDKQDFLSNFDLEENLLLIENLEKKIDEKRTKIEDQTKLYKEYPPKISLLFKEIFKNDIIKDQEMIMDYKENKPIFYFFNKDKRNICDSIISYYNCYLNEKTLTDGFDLYKEYTHYKNLTKEIEISDQDIYRLKDQLKSLRQEKTIFEKDIEEMRLFNSFEKVKKTAINKFVNFSSNVDNLDYYIEKITEYYQDKENFKSLYLLQLKEKFFEIFIDKLSSTESTLFENIKEVESIFKYIEFCKHEDIDYPYFSNVGYFENRLLGYKKAKIELFNIFAKKIIINTDNFEVFFEVFYKDLKNIYLKELLAPNKAFSIFNQIEINKFKKEKDAILKRYNKVY